MASNFFRLAAQRFVEARQRQAGRQIAAVLEGFGDETLQKLGRTRLNDRR